MAGGIEQFEPAAQVVQADAGAALVALVVFRETAVADATDNTCLFFMDVDVDKGGLHGADPVFEGVFDKGDEQERSDGRLRILGLDAGRQADLFG